MIKAVRCMDRILPYRASSDNGKWTTIFHTYNAELSGMFFCVDNAGYHMCYPSYRIKRRNYRTYLLLVNLQGEGELRLEGQTYALTPQNILLMDCVPPHEYYPVSSKPWCFAWIHFFGANAGEIYSHLSGQLGPVIRLPDATVRHIADEIICIIQLKQDEDIQFDIKASGILSGVLHDILLNSSYALSSNAELVQPSVASAVEFIKQNYNQEISLDDMAAAAHLSKYYFTKMFKSVTGYTPYEYLIKYRIDKAKFLLCYSGDTVSQIAQTVGFHNVNSFISSFKSFEDTTPHQFRKSCVPTSS